ncbi:hypothetical protein ACFQL4_16325 [Halosimplex aquaticum]
MVRVRTVLARLTRRASIRERVDGRDRPPNSPLALGRRVEPEPEPRPERRDRGSRVREERRRRPVVGPLARGDGLGGRAVVPAVAFEPRDGQPAESLSDLVHRSLVAVVRSLDGGVEVVRDQRPVGGRDRLGRRCEDPLEAVGSAAVPTHQAVLR